RSSIAGGTRARPGISLWSGATCKPAPPRTRAVACRAALGTGPPASGARIARCSPVFRWRTRCPRRWLSSAPRGTPPESRSARPRLRIRPWSSALATDRLAQEVQQLVVEALRGRQRHVSVVHTLVYEHLGYDVQGQRQVLRPGKPVDVARDGEVGGEGPDGVERIARDGDGAWHVCLVVSLQELGLEPGRQRSVDAR